MKVTINPSYENLRSFIESLPQRFADGEGLSLYKGRNEVRLFNNGDMRLVVKRFKRHDAYKQVAYTFFRKNKARRAFENAGMIRARGFDTPVEIAYMEEVCCGLIKQVYYICEYTDMLPIRGELVEKEPYNAELAACYARFVAKMHAAGVLHRDLNSTNTLFRNDGTRYSFQVIDINRMTFYDGGVPKAGRMENLTLLWRLTPVYMAVLRSYADASGWTEADIDRAVEVKRRHDRRWDRRKQFTGMLKRLAGKRNKH